MKLSDFTHLFAELNGLDIARWRFEPGMRHGDTLAWWGRKAPRRHVHYGIDLTLYETLEGTIRTLEAGARVPLPGDAAIAGTMEDFLGHTVVAAHGMLHGRQLIGLYGHVRPVEGITGKVLDAGSIIAELAHAGRSHVPPHLHLGMALVPTGTDLKKLEWNYLNDSRDVEHLDPLTLLLEQ